MLLRAAIVILVMLNLGAAGWWLFQPQPDAGAAPATAAPGLRLLRETPPALAAAAPPAAAATASPASAPPASATPPVAADAIATVASGTPAAAAEQAPVCVRFGPFADAASRNSARTALATAGVTTTAFDERARGVRGWKVFLPAQPSREAAVALAERLKAGGVADLFVMTQGADANSIALGRFSSETGARRRQAELRGKGVQAQIEPVGGTPAQAWLDARLPAEPDRSALARIARVQPLDCAQLR